MAGTDLYPVAGCKIYIGEIMATQIDDFIESDFITSPDQFTEIDGWTTMGVFGDTAALISTQLINRNRDIKQKGTTNAGSMQNVFAEITGDDGQVALIAASQGANKANYGFMVEFNDASGASGSVNSKAYFVGLVMNASPAGGAANTVRNLNATIEINSNVVRTAAT
ncbi:hypothetical protein [Mesorhizobium sp. M0058]|uniref:hypothetical protein n=1 Tax=Mesorhizobium sp. M0058 TaxID=2956865 RepID=UPI003339B51D